MGYRLSSKRSGHCSRRLMAVLVFAALPCAWADTSAPAKTQAAPSPKLNLYIGQAKDLLSNTQWQYLVATQPVEPAEPVSDSRDWSGTPVVQVKGERTPSDVPGGIGGLFWALRHPTQAWRIFAPNP